MISIVIPAYNEEQSIQKTIAHVLQYVTYKRLLQEIIVVDGGSTDQTVWLAKKSGARVIRCAQNNRSAMLNSGGRHARGKLIYFLPANALPPKNFINEIVKAAAKGFDCGTFSLQYDCNHWLLSAIAWASNRKKWLQVSDQSLFVSKALFDKSGGFREDHLVMANQEFINRAKRYTDFIVLKDYVVSSAKKYVQYGFFRTGVVQLLVFLFHKTGYSQLTMARLYRKFLRWDIGPKLPEKQKIIQEEIPAVRVATLQQ